MSRSGRWRLMLTAALTFSPVIAAMPEDAQTSNAVISLLSAEQHLSAAARRHGARRAFAATASPGAQIFVPDPIDVPEWLGHVLYPERWDPNITGRWVTTSVVLSCDGRTATTVGSWYDDERNGYYVTVWKRERGAWRWSFHFDDEEDKAPVPKIQSPKVRQASCRQTAQELPEFEENSFIKRHRSGDGSLVWGWRNLQNQYLISVHLWTGRSYEPIVRKAIKHDYE